MTNVVKGEVGETWGWTWSNGVEEAVRLAYIDANGEWVGGNGDRWTSPALCMEHQRKQWRLISPAPAKAEAERSGCKAWCGHKTWQRKGVERMNRPACQGFVQDGGGAGAIVWCSSVCGTAKYPPMGETKPRDQQVKELQASIEATLKKVDRPEPAKAPKCCHNGVLTGGHSHSTGCKLDPEGMAAWLAAQTGTPYTGPERLPAPKMAGDSWWPDFAEDVR